MGLIPIGNPFIIIKYNYLNNLMTDIFMPYFSRASQLVHLTIFVSFVMSLVLSLYRLTLLLFVFATLTNFHFNFSEPEHRLRRIVPSLYPSTFPSPLEGFRLLGVFLLF